MKKFIVLLISLFLGIFISNNTYQKDTIKKNDITTVAICTNNNVDIVSIDVISTDFTSINNGSSLYYYLNTVNNAITSNNHSILNSSNLITSYMMLGRIASIEPKYELVRIPTAKTLGLLGVTNKTRFNVYLYHLTNKLGQT